jgi:hypothetical protein
MLAGPPFILSIEDSPDHFYFARLRAALLLSRDCGSAPDERVIS